MPLMTGVATETMCGGCAMYHKVLFMYGYRDEQPHYICRSCIRALNRALDRYDKETPYDTKGSEREAKSDMVRDEDAIYI